MITFKACKKELLRAVIASSRGSAKNSTTPLLAHLHVAVSDDRVTMSGTDVDVYTSCTMPADECSEGVFTVPAKMLQDVVSGYPEDAVVTFTHDPATQITEARHKRSRYNLAGLDADKFPAPPTIHNTKSISLNQADLREAITKSIFALHTNITQFPFMCGVMFSIRNGIVDAWASNTSKFSCNRIRTEQDVEAVFAISKRTSLVIQAALNGGGCTLHIGDQSISIDIDGVQPQTISAPLVLGKIPNYRKSIGNTETAVVATLSLADIQSALKRMASLSSIDTDAALVHFDVRREEIELFTRSITAKSDAREYVECESNIDSEVFKVEMKILMDALATFDCASIEIATRPTKTGARIIQIREHPLDIVHGSTDERHVCYIMENRRVD